MKSEKNELKKIQKEVEKLLDGKRFEHTLGVAYTAACLAMRYGEDVEKARIAGMLHDCAKGISDEKKLSTCKKAGLPVSDAEQANPGLLHAKLGAYLAEKEFGITDPEILRAIKFHTTGRPGMSTFEKISYIADYIEPGRRTAPNLDEKRRMAFEDLDLALVVILRDILEYLRECGQPVDPVTEETYRYYAGEPEEDDA